MPAVRKVLLPATLLIALLAEPAYAQVETPQLQEPEPVQATQVEFFNQEDADVVLILQEVIDLALDKSFSVYQLKQSYLQESYSLEQAKRNLRTRIDLRSTIPSISQGLSPTFYFNPDSGEYELDYLRQGRTNFSTTLSVEQPLITNGTISLNSRLSGFQSFNELTGGSDPVQTRSVQPSLGVSYNQPLFQYNDIKNALRSAELSFESLDRTYTQDELSQINGITTQFYSLFRQQKSLANVAESFRLSDINYQTGLRKYQAGLIAEVDKMRLEVQRANDLDRLESAKNAHEQQQFQFNRRVGLMLETEVWVVASEEYSPIEVDVDRALELAFANRAELRLQEISIEQSEMNLRRTISQGRPNLQVNFGYDLTGSSTLGGLGYDDPWSDHIGEAFNPDNRSPNTNVSLTLRVPIFDWGRNESAVQRQMAGLTVQKRRIDEVEQDMKRDVINRVRSVDSAMRRMEIQTANRAVAERSFEISQMRYERGETTIVELLNDQEQFNSTKEAFLSALIQYEQAKASLKEYTLWDWETNQPVRRRTSPPTPFGRN
jgi:outer membrane protein TolC